MPILDRSRFGAHFFRDILGGLKYKSSPEYKRWSGNEVYLDEDATSTTPVFFHFRKIERKSYS